MMQEGGGANPYANMVMGQIGQMQQKIGQLGEMVNQDTELEPWVTTKMTLANDYLNSVENYLEHNPEAQQPVMQRGGYMNPFSAIAQFAYGGHTPMMQSGGGQYSIGQYVPGMGYWNGSSFQATNPNSFAPSNSQYESDPSTMPLQAPPPPVDPLAPDPNDPYNAKNLNPQYAQQNAASKTGVVNPPIDPATTAPWRAGMTDQQAQQNLANRYNRQGTEYMRRRPGYGSIILNGLAIGAGSVSASNRLKEIASNNINTGGSWNTPFAQGSKGNDYNVNRMSQPGAVISQPGNFAPYRAQMGGMMARNNMYQQGGVYDMDEAEIADLISKGYKVQYV
jgi:hypothetical protein